MQPSSIVGYYKECTVAMSFKTSAFPQINSHAPTGVFDGMSLPTPFFPVETVQSFSLVAGSVSRGGTLPPGSAIDPSARVVWCVGMLLLWGRQREWRVGECSGG